MFFLLLAANVTTVTVESKLYYYCTYSSTCKKRSNIPIVLSFLLLLLFSPASWSTVWGPCCGPPRPGPAGSGGQKTGSRGTTSAGGQGREKCNYKSNEHTESRGSTVADAACCPVCPNAPFFTDELCDRVLDEGDAGVSKRDLNPPLPDLSLIT